MTGAYFVLDAHGEAVPCASAEEWARAFDRDHPSRIVARDEVGGLLVSTVFLGVDHGHFGGPPRIFETMVFEVGMDVACERYSTRAEALEGHARMVERVRSGEFGEAAP